MWVLFTVVATAIALFLYASLWVPRLGSHFHWKQTDIHLGFVSRVGFMLVFGVPALVGIVGMPAEKYRRIYAGFMILGFVLAALGAVNDWLRERA
jgi:hypothetical protein